MCVLDDGCSVCLVSRLTAFVQRFHTVLRCVFTLRQAGGVRLALVLEADGAGVYSVLIECRIIARVALLSLRITRVICESAPQGEQTLLIPLSLS